MSSDPQDIETIERRSAAVASVREVVHAIWSLARSELPLAEASAREARSYVQWLDRTLSRLTLPADAGPARDVVHLVIGPERSYSGALPIRTARALPPTGALGLVGARFTEVALRDPEVADRVLFSLPGASAIGDVDTVGRSVAAALLRHAAERSVVLHHMANASGQLHAQRLVFRRGALLDFPPDTFSPPEEVADAVLVEAVSGELIAAVAESLCSEISARMLAAERAKLACDRRLDELAQNWRTARQERITSELLEAVAGAQALRSASPPPNQ
ncbi:MAG: F0F1 ATP synthase subunit gamma [Myxococcales bacterium]|nr:F0F1 ATP synthase subunit gamma [Myxococcales bacterium]